MHKICRLYSRSAPLAAIVFSLFIGLASFLRNSQWFTTSAETIDPWIYWGAGNNLPLSYQADFSKTYYLERYVLTFSQTVSQFIFGPYWSQLFLSILYIAIISYTFIVILNLYGFNKLSLPLILVFFSNEKFLGMLAMSYNQGASLSLLALGALFLVKYAREGDRKFTFYYGVTMALLANTYLPHALVGYVVAIAFLAGKMAFRKFVSWMEYSLVGFVWTQFIIQTIHYLISREYQVVLLKHLRFGFNNLTNENPWGGEGFIWFWSQGIFSQLGFFWVAEVIFGFILIFAINKERHISLDPILRLGIGVIIGMCAFTFGHSNIIGYSWFSCVLFYILFPTLVFTFNNWNIKYVWAFALMVLAKYLFSFSIVDKLLNLVLQGKTLKNLLIAISLIILFSAIFLLRTGFKLVASIIILVLVVTIQSSIFVASEGGISRNLDAKKIYSETSDQRSALKAVNIATGRRVWITPFESTPVQSSMLYMYSLISTDRFKADCNQVNWMRTNHSVIVITNSNHSKEKSVSNVLLKPCGIDASSWTRSTFSRIPTSYLLIN